MHKGYTLNYFIKFFSNIPSHRWTRGHLVQEGTTRCCALGHCIVGNKSAKEVKKMIENDAYYTPNARWESLNKFLEGNVAAINDDNTGLYSYLGSTPRARILKALRLRKKGYRPLPGKAVKIRR